MSQDTEPVSAGRSLTGTVSSKPKNTVAASSLMLLTTFFWAGNLVAGKFALTGFSSLALAQVRMAASGLLYWVLYISYRGLPSLRLSRRQWLILGLMALTGITLNQIFYIGGLARTSVTHAGLIQAIGPVMVLLLAGFLRIETLTRWKIAGMGVSFTGVAILLIERPGRASGAHWSGDLMMIAAGGVFAWYTILMKEVAHLYDTLTLNALVFGLGAILLVPFCASATARVSWAHVSGRAWAGLGFMVLFGSLVAYLIYGFALQELAASTVASFSYLQPVMAAALGVWLLGERITVSTIVGGAVILAGVYLTEHARGAKRHIRHLATGKV
ncbi:MAG: DMT family transporter [Terriglobia bacterium]